MYKENIVLGICKTNLVFEYGYINFTIMLFIKCMIFLDLVNLVEVCLFLSYETVPLKKNNKLAKILKRKIP